MKLADLPIVVINLNCRPDRWQHVQQQLSAVGLRAKAQRFAAVKPTESIMKSKACHFMPTNKRSELYRAGSFGCLQSHRSVITMAKKQNWPAVLILEDDVVFAQNMKTVVQKALDQLASTPVELFYLSANHIVPGIQIMPNVMRVRRAKTTHAYIVMARAYNKIIQDLERYPEAIDEYYMYKIQSRKNAYGAMPPVAHQRADYSDIVHKRVSYRLASNRCQRLNPQSQRKGVR